MRREERVLREQEEQEEQEEKEEQEEEQGMVEMEGMEDMETGVKLHLWEAVCCHYSSDFVDFLLHYEPQANSLFLLLTNLLWSTVQDAVVHCSAV